MFSFKWLAEIVSVLNEPGKGPGNKIYSAISYGDMTQGTTVSPALSKITALFVLHVS